MCVGACCALLQGAPAGGGLVGLYADFAMLNHSCCPNTINLVGGPHRHMVVRATEDIAEGGEVGRSAGWDIGSWEEWSRLPRRVVLP